VTSRHLVASVVGAALLVAGCTGGSHVGDNARSPSIVAPEPSGTPSTTSPSSASASATPTPTAASLPSGLPGRPVDVVTGLDVPWSIAVLPDGSALISLRDEARIIRVTKTGAKTALTATGPSGTVPGVIPAGEGGLLGLALSPRFAHDHLVYAYASRADDNAVLAMALIGNKLGAPREIIGGIPRSVIHNGGRIAFGPDGFLYVATGDATDRGSAQNRDALSGKILRLTADGEPAPGNPFGTAVWSWGHRNVQGLGWAADGTMYASEFGQDRLDELNRITPGGNYGWPRTEGPDGPGGFIDPLVVWPTDQASPSGIVVTADAVYLAALRGQRLWRVPLSAQGVGTPQAFYVGELGRLRDVVLAPGGGLWVLTSNTFRGKPRAGDDRMVHIPLS